MYNVALSDFVWLELWLSFRLGQPCWMVGGQVGMVWDSPGLFAEDALAGQLMLKEGGGSWGIRCRGTWQGGWSRGRRRPGCPKVFCLGYPVKSPGTKAVQAWSILGCFAPVSF